MDVSDIARSGEPRVTPLDADRLAEGRRIRSIPNSDSVLSEEPRDYDHYAELAAEATAPHWNSAVDVLHSGPEGYLALTRLHDRLADHRAQEQLVYDRAGLTGAVARRALDVIKLEGEQRGPGTSIREALSNDGRTATPWEWRPEAALFQPQIELDRGGTPNRYRLHDPEVDRLLTEFNALGARDTEAALSRLLSFDADKTWSSAKRSVEGAARRYALQERKEWRERRLELIEFRLAVVDQVLREHEMLGYVGEFGESPRPVDLNEEEETFLVEASRALRLVDDGELSPTWFAMSQWIGDQTGWSRSRIERIAGKRLRAFKKGAGSGKPTAQEQEERYTLFRTTVRRLASAAGLDETPEDANDR